MLRPRHHLVAPLDHLFRAVFGDRQRFCRGGRDADERHLLDIRAVGVAGLQPELLELGFEVLDGQLFALGAGRAPLVLVGGEHLDAVEDCRGFDLREVRQGNLRCRSRLVRRCSRGLLRATTACRCEHENAQGGCVAHPYILSCSLSALSYAAAVGVSTAVRLPSSRSMSRIDAASSPIMRSLPTISRPVFSSSTCSVRNHCSSATAANAFS